MNPKATPVPIESAAADQSPERAKQKIRAGYVGAISGLARIAAQARSACPKRSETSNQRRNTSPSSTPARSINARAGSSAPRAKSISIRAKNRSSAAASLPPRGGSSSDRAKRSVKSKMAGGPVIGKRRNRPASSALSDWPQSPLGKPVTRAGKSPTALRVIGPIGITRISSVTISAATSGLRGAIVSESQLGAISCGDICGVCAASGSAGKSQIRPATSPQNVPPLSLRMICYSSGIEIVSRNSTVSGCIRPE